MKKLTVILFLSCIVSFVNAQNLFTNDNSILSIDGGVTMSIQGSASNTGTIYNEGEMRLSGNWANSGVYSSVSGTFTLEGDNQIFEPGESSYSNFTLNSTGVVATSSLMISQSLILETGILSIDSESSILLDSEAIIVGGSEDSYIDGVLFTSAQGNFTFPIGTEKEFLPVIISNIQSTNPIGVQAFSSQLNANLSSEISSISPSRYWQLISDPAFIADDISLPLNNESFIKNENEATIAFTTELSNPLSSIGGSTISGSLTSGSIKYQGDILSGYYVLAAMLSGSEPPIKVINIVTALQDGKHDFLRIENIEFYEENRVEIFTRNGTKVFEMSGYNNADRVFRGVSNVRNSEPLATGSYFFTVQFSEKKRESGFIYLKN